MGAERFDAVVVGSGPNGLSAAIVLARHGLSVLVLEANEKIGGGCRTSDLTLPGFKHDVCSAIHPMGVLSPAFREFELEKYGLEWAKTIAPVAHPLADGKAVILHQSLDDTARKLGHDQSAWTNLYAPLLAHSDDFFSGILQPIRFPKHPLLMARFGLAALRSADSAIKRFRTAEARALFTGCAAHAILPLTRAGTASFGIVLALAGHAVGWPCAKGGSASITEALANYFQSLGGVIRTNALVKSLKDIPESKAVLFDVAPRSLASITRDELPSGYVRRLERFQHGPGVFKIDWALDGAIPWKNPECALAATVHVGGTAEEIIRAEDQVGRGEVPDQPFVLVAQQSLFDSTRALAGKHTGWAYCHVPPGCIVDMTERIEQQIERFAPGFRDRILAKHVMNPQRYESYNPNLIGGDIGGGANTLAQTLFRPFPRWDPYSTPNPRLYLCSSSTPPGGGVHGMCGYWAARSVLRRSFNSSPV